MLTIFTTTKDFNEATTTNQVNAIGSWINAGVPTQVLIFSKTEGEPLKQWKNKITYVTEFETSPTNVPLIGSMFQIAARLSSFPILCFVNADIILPHSFFKTIAEIDSKLNNKDYLLVGERFDVDFSNKLDFSD